MIGDNVEIRIAHEYATLLARLAGVNAQTFWSEAAPIRWLSTGT